MNTHSLSSTSWAVGLALALLAASASQAQTTYPGNNTFFQTSGRNRAPTIGDWYTSTGTSSTDRIHRFLIGVTPEQLAAAGGTVTVTIGDGESTAGAGPNDEVQGTSDPTRFTLRASNGVTILATRTFASGSPNARSHVFSITAAGNYQITSETGAFPISGNAAADLNDDDNSFTITVSSSAALFGPIQFSTQHNQGGTVTIPYYFLVGPTASGTSALELRNFDADGNATSVVYTRPNTTTITGTVSNNGVWNGPTPTVNAGFDAITATSTNTATGGDGGVWGFTVNNLTTNNQLVVEANGDSVKLVLFEDPPTAAGSFVIGTNGTLGTLPGQAVDHSFTVLNDFQTNDIINLTTSGTGANYTVQLLDNTLAPLTDTDGDSVVDTGILTPNQTKSFVLRVTPNAGATQPDVTRVSGVSFMDKKVDSVNNTIRFIERRTELAGVTVTPTSGLVTNEGGGTATFSVVLKRTPTAPVTFSLSSTDTGEGTVSPSTLTFTVGNALVPQVVTVTGIDDALVDGPIAFSITTGAGVSSDPLYSGLNPSDVSVTNNDNDSPGVTVTPTSGLTTTEAGGQATFTVVLNTIPSANVTIPVSSSNTAEGTVSTGTLTFTPGNALTPQTVTLTGVNDQIDDDDVAYTAILGAAAGAAEYVGINPTDVSVTNTDDDTAGVTVTPTSGLITTEAGGQATFTVRLNTIPTAPMSFTITSSDPSEGSVSPTSLTFAANATALNPQTVTVTGVQDALTDGTVAYTILTGTGTGGDAKYQVNPADVSVSNTDDDSPGITVTPVSGLQTTESGGTATFSVVLNTLPVANVVIGISSSDTGEGTVSAASLTFTNANGTTPQIVTVTGVNDTFVDGNVGYQIVTAPATGAAGYAGINPSDVLVTNIDNDAAGVTVTPTSGLVTTEAGGTATFTVVLDTTPSADVSLTLVSSDTGEGTPSAASLTFTPGNALTPQTVTVTGVDDAINDGPILYLIQTGTTTSTDPLYNGVTPLDVSVTNTDDEVPTVTVVATDASATEPGGAGTTGLYTISRAGYTGNALTVNFAMSGTATNGTDYASLGPSVTIPIGASSATVTLSVTDDALLEGNETATLTLAANAAYIVGTPSTATVTIADDERPTVTVTASDPNAAEPSGNPGQYTFSRTGPTTAALTVNFAVSGTATNGTDYASLGTSITIPSGSATATRALTVTDDALLEGNETAIVTLAANAAYTVGTPSVATVTIADDERPVVTVTASDPNAAEPSGNPGQYTFSRTGPTTAALTVNFAVSGTATNGTDYASLGTSITIPSGSSSTTRALTVTDDALLEGNETAIVTLAANAAYVVGTPSVATVTIADDERPTVTVTASDPNAAEPSGNPGQYTFSRTGPTTAALTVQFTVSGTATNGTDYASLGTSITIPSGSSSTTRALTVTDDALLEGSETAIVTLAANAAYTIGTPSTATVTIADDERPTVTITASDSNAAEPSGNPGEYTFTRTGPTTAALTVNFTVSGTATDGTDYATLGTSITIPSGSGSATRALTVTDDALLEGNETAIVTLAANAAYVVGTPSTATVTIADDERPVVTVTASDPNAAEPSGNPGQYTFSRTGPTTAALTVNFTVSGTATNGTDYTSLGTSITIPSGSATATRALTVTDDALLEGDETAIVTLAANAAYTLGTPSAATVTIADDERPVVTVTASDPNAAEPSGNPGQYTFSRTGPTTAALTVNFTVSGTATNGTDYTSLGTSITIPSGSSSTTRALTVTDDALLEGDETAIVTLAANAAYTIGTPSTATVTIVDDELSTVTVTASDPNAAEPSGNPGEYTFSRTGPTTAALTVNFTVSGTATDGTDYTSLGTSITIPSGSASTTRALTVTDDALLEGDETAIVTLAANAAYTIGTPSTATVTIADNDVATVTVTASDPNAAEPSGNPGQYTFTRTGPTTAALTVQFTVSGTATDGTDYATLGTSITIPSGSASTTRALTVTDDALLEGDETAIVTLAANAAYTIGTPSTATVTIADDERPTVTVTASDPNAAEPSGNPGQYTFSRTGPTTAALTVNFTVGGTATDGTDYTSLGTSITIPSGSATATRALTVTDDALLEGNETAIVTLAANAAYTVGTPSVATVTIADDERPTVTVTASDPNAAEPSGNPGQYTFSRTGPTTAALTVDFTVSGTATDGTDYTSLGTSITIPSGSATATRALTVTDDALLEGNETAIVTLAANAAYTVGTPSTATVTIADDERPTVTITASDSNAAEPSGNPGQYTFSRTGPTTAALTVNFTVSGTATDGTDYATLGTSITIPSGSSSATRALTVTDDALLEGDETAIVTLAANAAYTIGTPSTATVTIADDERPVVTVTASDPNAAEPSANPGQYTFTRTGPTTVALTVDFTVGGTATDGTDYATLGTSITIPSGSSSTTRALTVTDDALLEGDETAIVTLAANAAYTVGTPSVATVTIADDERPIVTVTASDPTAAEPSANPGEYTFSRTGPTTAALTVNFTVSGTATDGTDYTSLGTSITIPSGSASTTRALTVTDDALLEGDETAIVTLAANAAYTLGAPSTATVTIADDERPTVTVTASDASAAEPSGNPGEYTFSRTGPTTAALTVNFTVSGTATNGTDYTSLGTSITIPSGSATATRALTVTDDALLEGDETAIVTLAANAAYTVGTPSVATVTIADDERPTVTVTASDSNAAEPSGDPGEYTFTRTGPTTVALTVNFTVSGTATDGTDYATLGTSITIPSGSATATRALTVTDDALLEGNETAIVTLAANAAYTIGTPSTATVTIADDERPVVTITASDASAAEPSGDPGEYTFSRTGPTTAALTVNFTVGGTASDGADFTSLGTSITIPSGSATATRALTVTDDALLEGSETAIVTLAANAAYTIGTPSAATVTIADDERPVVTITASDANAAEPSGDPGQYTFSRTGPTTAALTVNFTVSGTATNGTDYTSLGTSITIPSGSATATRALTVTDDALLEGDETAIVTLAANAAYTIGTPSTATVTITDDELATVTVAATDANAAEPSGDPGEYTFTRTGPTTAALTVNFTVGGTATDGTDYATLGTSITIPSGSSSTTRALTVTDDALLEGDETAIVTLAANAAYAIGTPSAATVTIADNDVPTVTVTASDPNAAEPAANPGEYTFSRTGPTTAALTVNFTVSGSATSGTDYTALGTSITIPSGSATATRALTVTDDALLEGDETAVVTLAANAAYSIGTPSAATVTIADDERPVVTITASDPNAAEPSANPGQYTFSRTGPTAAALTVNFTVSGTATDGTDFSTLGTSIVIPSGSATATRALAVIDDGLLEGDETAIVTLAANAAYTLGTPATATVTIADDERPVVTVTASDASAAEPSGDPGQYTFTRTGPTTAALTVQFTVSGTATDGTDYATLGTSITIPSGSSSTTRALTVTDDALLEGDETAIVTLAANPSYTIGTPSAATVTISDDERPTVTVAATDANAAEPGPADTGVYTLTRTGPTGAALTVNFSMSGTATNGTDYASLGPSATIPIGASSTTVTLTVTDDALFEGSETATLTIQPNAAYTVGTASADVAIADDEVPTVSVAVTDASASEAGPDAGVYTVSRTGPTGAALTVVFAMSGTATNGTDYASLGPSVTIPIGASSATVTLTPTDDALSEGPETATLTLQANAAYAIGTASGDVTIADDEFPAVTVTATDAAAAEAGSDPGTYTFTRTGPTTAALTIVYALSGTATDGTDFATLGTSITIPIGATSATRTLTPTDDALVEGDETATLTIQPNAAYSIATASADVVISDNNVPTVTVTASDPNAAEAGLDTATFTFTRSGSTAATLTVNYAMSGTATDGTDYATLGTSVTFAIGASTATRTLTPIDDGIAEGSETAILTIQANAAYSSGGASATATIADDDTVGITVTPTSGLTTTEAGGTATFTVRLNSLPTNDVTITLVSDDTTEGTVGPATLTFTSANGTTAQTVTVTGVDDAISDGDVGYSIQTSNAVSTDPAYSGLAVPDVSVTNTDDEVATGQFSFSAAGYEVREDGGSVTITVVRTGGTGSAATVNYTTSDQTATAGADYTTSSGTLSFAIGETSKTFTVSVNDDALREVYETIGLSLSAPTGGTSLGTQSFATITLRDETTPQIVTPSLPNGQVGSPYGAPLDLGDGGTGPLFDWSISSGTFPPGLSLIGDGRTIQVTGTPTQSGVFTFEVSVRDSLGELATRSYTVTIGASAPTTNPEIGDQAPPPGTVRQPYDFRPSLTNGSGPFTWSIASGTLPPGLSFDPSTGRIAGTPTQTGTFTICLQVTDSNSLTDTTPTGSCAAGEEQTFTISPDRIQIGTVDLPDALQNAPYGAPVVLSDSGVGATYTWSVSSGTLPPGLSLSGTGTQITLQGTPTTVGTFTFTLQASDDGQAGVVDTQTYVVTVSAPGGAVAVQLQTQTLPTGTVGAGYSSQLVSSGGTGPYSYALTNGPLPPGLSLSATGQITGTPTAGGTYSITVTVTDQGGQTSTRTYALTIANPPQITTAALPGGVQNQGYAAQVKGINGVGPYLWSVVGGIGPDASGNFSGGGLPAGLVINQTSGVISGTPTAAPGTYPLTVRLTDREGVVTTKALSIEILGSGATPAVVTQNLPGGDVGQPYSTTLQGTGGTPGYTWSLTSGTLPAGLTLDPTTGVISGVPTTPGTATLVFEITDQAAQTTSSISLSLPIQAAVAITTTSLPPGIPGSPYTTTLIGAGGVGPFTWTLISGSLPPGFSLNPNGTISGTTGNLGTFPLVLRLTDSEGRTTTRSLSLVIQNATGGGGSNPGPTTLQLTTPTLPGGVVGTPYDQPLIVVGGTGPYTYLSNGGLPPGLALDPNSGRLQGTPSGSGSFTFTITVMDQNGLIASRSYTVVIAVAPAATGGGLASSAGSRIQGSGSCQVTSPAAAAGSWAWAFLLLVLLLPLRRGASGEPSRAKK